MTSPSVTNLAFLTDDEVLVLVRFVCCTEVLVLVEVCVLYWSMVRCWCRATVESVVEGPVSMTTQVRCFLVDHGERVVVMSDQ